MSTVIEGMIRMQGQIFQCIERVCLCVRVCVCARAQHEWKYADGRPMTREDFMDILFYVDYILIKASHGNLMRHSRYDTRMHAHSKML